VSRAHPAAATAALASTALLASFLQTIMTPLVPEFPAEFSTSASAVSWVLTAALLAACASAPVSGRLGDLVGKKRVLLALLGVIVLGSIVGGLSVSLPGVIAARALQGIGLGVMALNVSTLRDVLPPERVPAAIAFVSASNGIGGGLGLPLSAVIAEHLDWHWLFWLAAVLALISAGLVQLAVPDVPGLPAGARPRFDVLGALGLGSGLIGVLLAISQAETWGVASPATLGCGVGGLVVLALWVRHELRVSAPLVDLRLLTRRSVLLVNLLCIGAGFCWFAVPGAVTRLLQSPSGSGVGLGLDMVATSLVVVPTGLLMLAVSPLNARLVAARGPRFTIRLGGTLLAAAYLVATLTGSQAWQLAIVAGLVGIGSGMVYSAAPIVIMRSVPATATASANGFNAVMRWFGSTLASGILGAILAGMATQVGAHPVPTAGAFHLSFGIAAGTGAIVVLLASFLPAPGRGRVRAGATGPVPTSPVEISPT
jgi:MFS family permease